MDQELFKELLSQHLSGKLSHEQQRRLADFLTHKEYREYFGKIARNDFMEDKYLGEENLELKSAIQNFLSKEISRTTRMPAKLIRVRRMIAAASVILFLTALSSLFILQKSNKSLTAATIAKPILQDVPPGKTGAVLTLSDGSKIVLDSLQGSVGLQGHSQVINKNGLLSYSVKNNSSSEVVYNTMSTPVGRQYQVVLADGTKVWLDAASSITYPTSFPGDDRKVSIKGEAYFEVVHDARKPFHVMINDLEVRVLGTHFNINAYENEDAIKTTLIEGSVKVIKSNSNILIVPGQQAIAINGNNDVPLQKKEVDLDEVMAWKNSKFNFLDADIKSVMHQLERWYGVNASYEGNVTSEEFVGVISRNVNISQILAMLEKTGTVRFKIQGKNIIVK